MVKVMTQNVYDKDNDDGIDNDKHDVHDDDQVDYVDNDDDTEILKMKVDRTVWLKASPWRMIMIKRENTTVIQTMALNDRFFSDAVDMIADKDKVLADLRDLERKYHRTQISREVALTDRFLVWMKLQKPPFRPGDDVWTRMERNTQEFVERVSRRY